MSDHQEAQGDAIERLQKHAAKEITREDFTTMNCASFKNLKYVCNFIGETECIDSTDRVYTGLCAIGRDKCYSAYRHNGNRDVFSEIAKYVSIGKTSMNMAKQEFADVSVPLFDYVDYKKLGTSIDESGLVGKIAGKWKIQKSHLNLYHALTGLKYITENEPTYIEARDQPLLDDPLRVLTTANMKLNNRRDVLQALMGI